MTLLRGITWDHPRGYDPLVATAGEFSRRHPHVSIDWQKRSLQDFGDASVEELAEKFDLLVIDHPHVGGLSAGDCLVPLDDVGRAVELRQLQSQSVARSHESYCYAGHQWALAIDVAAHVSSYRPDLIDSPPRTWDQVRQLASQGRVIWPLKPIDSLMSFFSLCANLGMKCADRAGELIDPADGIRVLKFMREFVDLLGCESLEISPPQALDLMSAGDRFVYCPLGFGYTNYSRQGFRKNRIRFTDIPLGTDGKCGGSILGGTGLAISRRCRELSLAADYAFWIAGAECQRTLYFASGGQPANLAAWSDDAVNAACDNFFRNTRETLDRSWIRPRFSGYVGFQTAASTIVHRCLAGEVAPAATIAALREEFSRA